MDKALSLDHLSPETEIEEYQPKSKNVFQLAEFQENKDHFIERDGLRYAGTHLIIDLWGVKGTDSAEKVEHALRKIVTCAKATLLHIHLHKFTPNGGISGVAVLAESHISVHTWPEREYAAFDVFMCGDSEPHKAIDVLREIFSPTHFSVNEHLRGMVNDSSVV